MKDDHETRSFRSIAAARLDAAGTFVSWLCAAHCLVLPLFLSALQLYGLVALASKTAEMVIVVISVAIALLTLLPSYHNDHGRPLPLLLFISGLVFIIFPQHIINGGHLFVIASMICGSVMVSAAHILNRRYCAGPQECHVCCEHNVHVSEHSELLHQSGTPH